MAKGYMVSIWADKIFLKLMCSWMCNSVCSTKHWIVHFKGAKCMLFKYMSIKIILKYYKNFLLTLYPVSFKDNIWYMICIIYYVLYMVQHKSSPSFLQTHKRVILWHNNITLKHTVWHFRWNTQIKTINYYIHIITLPTTLKQALLLPDPVFTGRLPKAGLLQVLGTLGCAQQSP